MKICKFFDVIGMGCLVVALLAGCSAPTAAAGGAQATSASATAVVVGTDATFPPFESLDAPRRTIVGFDLNEVAPGPEGDWDANVGARLLYKLIGWTLVSQGLSKPPERILGSVS